MNRTIVLAVALAAFAPMPRAAAATFTVNATTDAVDLLTGDGICDSAPSPAVVCTLRAAVQEANALAGGDCADNASQLGGAIRNLDDLVMERVALTGNRALIGGGLFNVGTASATDVEIAGNEATNRAGGIASASFSASGTPSTSLTLARATVGPNTTLIGPSELELANAGNAALTNVTVSPASTAMGSVTLGNQDVQLVHVTVLGGVSFFSFDGSHQVDFANSAVDYCIPTSPEFMPSIVRSGVNASSDASCGFAAAGGIEGALGLGPLADNGGATPTHLPLAGSPLLDAAGETSCVETDQRGFPRPSGSGCDIGAIEVPEPSGALAAAAVLLGVLAVARRRTA